MSKAVNKSGNYQDISIGKKHHIFGLLRLSAIDEFQGSMPMEKIGRPPRCTSQRSGMSFQSHNLRRLITKIFYFSNGLDVAVQFIPVLRLYVTNRLRDTTIMCGTMDPTTAIWSHNLAGLADSSSWVLYMDDVGAYHIKQA